MLIYKCFLTRAYKYKAPAEKHRNPDKNLTNVNNI